MAKVQESSNPQQPSPRFDPAWADLSLDEIDLGWQEATNEGPSALSRQIAYALATSRHHPPAERDPAPKTPLPLPDNHAAGLLALTTMLDTIPSRQHNALREEIGTLTNNAVRARALLNLGQQLSGERRRAVLREAYEAIGQVESTAEQVQLFSDLLPLLRVSLDGELPSGITAEIMDIASSITNTEARLRSLTALAQYLPPTIRIAILLAVLDNVTTMTTSDSQAGALIALAPYLMGEVHHRTLTVAAQIEEPAARARTLTTLAQVLPPRMQARLQAAALEAIAVIEDEPERARALALFAPYLEQVQETDESFPVLLERALALAVNMDNRDARAQALVGLHARLPRNLQGEALAAVNSIADEHIKAELLADLAPSLPPDMAIGALAVVHSMQRPDARYLTLIALGRQMEGGAAERTWLDVLAVAIALPGQLERVLALAEVAPYLSDDLRSRTLNNALTTARSIKKERARVRALSTLAPLMTGHQQLLADALADAHTFTNPMEQSSALIALVPHLPPGDTTTRTIDEVLGCIINITVEYRQTRELISIAPYLSGEQLHEGLRISQRIADPYDRATTLMAFLPRLEDDDERRRFILASAWESASDITDDYDRATALAALWPFAATDMQQPIVRQVLTAVREIEDDYDRASGISVFAPLLASEDLPTVLPQETQVLRQALLTAAQIEACTTRARALACLIPLWLETPAATVGYALWCEVLIQISQRPTAHLLSDLAALAPVIRALGGTATADETVQAITAARAW